MPPGGGAKGVEKVDVEVLVGARPLEFVEDEDHAQPALVERANCCFEGEAGGAIHHLFEGRFGWEAAFIEAAAISFSSYLRPKNIGGSLTGLRKMYAT